MTFEYKIGDQEQKQIVEEAQVVPTKNDYIRIQHHYARIMSDTELLLELAASRGRNLADTYGDCRLAIVTIGKALKEIEAKELAIRKGVE